MCDTFFTNFGNFFLFNYAKLDVSFLLFLQFFVQFLSILLNFTLLFIQKSDSILEKGFFFVTFRLNIQIFTF